MPEPESWIENAAGTHHLGLYDRLGADMGGELRVRVSFVLCYSANSTEMCDCRCQCLGHT